MITDRCPRRHRGANSRNLEFILLKHLEANPVGWIYDAPFDVVLTECDVYQPDLVFVSRSRDSILTERGAEGAPDLVVEILSPATAAEDEGVKVGVYARAGVEELWIVDPALRQIRVYRLQEKADAPAAIHGDGARVVTPILPGLIVDTDEVFRR